MTHTAIRAEKIVQTFVNCTKEGLNSLIEPRRAIRMSRTGGHRLSVAFNRDRLQGYLVTLQMMVCWPGFWFAMFKGKEGRGHHPKHGGHMSIPLRIEALSELKPSFGDRQVFTFSDSAVKYREAIVELCECVQRLPDTSDALKAHLNKYETAL